jgi:hypothetical protein
MEQKHHIKIINSIKTYLHTGDKIDPIDREAWTDVLARKVCKYDMAKAAIKQLKKELPPVNNFGKLPNINDFWQIYKKLSRGAEKDSHKGCRYCKGEGFVFIARLNGVVLCDGKTLPEKEIVDPNDEDYLRGLKFCKDRKMDFILKKLEGKTKMPEVE